MENLLHKDLYLTTEQKKSLSELEDWKDLAYELSKMIVFERNRCGKLIAKKRAIIRERDDLKLTIYLAQRKLLGI